MLESAGSPGRVTLAVAASLPVLAPVFALLFAATCVQAQTRGNAQAEQNRAFANDGQLNRGQPSNGLYTSEIGERFIFDGRGARPLFRFERPE